jgi:N-acetylglucosamine-6-phosphate deacetylase
MNNKLLIKNGSVVLPDGISENTDILVEGGKIANIGKNIVADNIEILDVNGSFVFPGFIDVHIHGGGGADFMDGTAEAFETAAKAHLKRGTTTLVPTAMTASKEELKGFINAYHEFKAKSPYADLAQGLHFEGPYFSNANSKSKGAQKGDIIRDIDFDEVNELIDLANGNIIRWDSAPEIPNSAEFAKLMCENGIICAAAHTDSTGYEAEAGFKAGFSHVTHFYNACTAYKKREQIVTAGIVEAAYLDDSVTVELICDGRHIPEHCLKLALKIKGVDKVLGITDATRLACTEEKNGMLGSKTNGSYVIVDDGVAKLPDMTSYAGSICTMDRALRVLCVDYGIDVVTAAKMLSSSPAKHIGMQDTLGSIEKGKQADIVVADSGFNVINVIKNGIISK